MAFSYTLNHGDSTGNEFITGSFTNTGGSTGGAIATLANEILAFTATGNATAPDIYASISGGTVTMTCKANLSGTFIISAR